MRTRTLSIATLGTLTLAMTLALTRHPSPEITVHEWGTFTSVAGVDGRAIDWIPLGGPTDLPCFVKHVRSVILLPKVAPGIDAGKPLSFENARTQLWGKVRMETPVIYFYSPREYAATVTVRFPRGVITEFFPSPRNGDAPFTTAILTNPNQVHTVQWNVKASPAFPEIYPTGDEQSHYYAARATDATPLRVGAESEKFIFYRGVASFDVPIQTRLIGDDNVEIWNLLPEGVIPTAILFESRAGRIGYRVAGAVSRADTVARPTLDAALPALREDLHKSLVAAGLYPREATAMLDTWRDSWFEEGLRVFYILPQRAVDAILPLNIAPAPDAVSRVFVGRMELIDRATMNHVKAAVDANDARTLALYGRFLHPISDRIVSTSTDGPMNDRLTRAANAAFEKYTRQLRVCE